MTRKLASLLLILALVFGIGAIVTDTASAQTWGGYGAGFTPSPQAVYDPWGRVAGVARVDQGYYQPPYQNYGFGGYGGSGVAIVIGTRNGGIAYWANQPSWNYGQRGICPRCGRRHH